MLFRRSCLVCRRDGPALCVSCRRGLAPPPVTRVRGVGRVPAAFAYDGTGARVIQALKFRDGRRLVGPVADLVAPLVPPDAESVTWLPTSGARRRERGFDQAELLARAVARRCDLPVVRLLARRPGAAQTGRSRDEREGNACFVARGSLAGPVVAVDDVCTTGATARAALGALRPVTTDRVTLVVAARTP
ncbi:MAG: hypothetical protein U5K30_09435 [Acidimicrobiales bacterium]|nr:hypothetical protein [Acidimicrobiales bacterium]